ncbi:diguanylate cyclase [Rhizobium sp. NTR19]|uniref:diguanylate cyclase n=1 Tax=Neorhizobium turbinariae TaxID=2937795 RepID=A0ABT0IU29_9HYPH|nr:diguanylate cyclase [Neorhizobium turbinariae]MCK8781373.1 diguanylate cyclase [Neorhizobium turbinariae]
METGNIIIFIPPALFTIVSLAFLLLWQLKITPSWQWSAGFAQTALGFVLSTFSIEPSFDAFSSGLVFIGAAYCYAGGLLTHFAAPQSRRERLAFVVAYTIVLAYSVFTLGSLKAQLFVTDVGFALLLVHAVWAAITRATRPVDIALLVSTVLVIFDSVLRAVFFTFFTDLSDDLGDFAHSAYNLAVHVTTITVCMFFPFTALAATASSAIERYRDDASRDPLTGLLNRRGFEQVIASRRRSAAIGGAVVTCDIDHFKQINDSYGHAAGDKVIAGLAHDLDCAVTQCGYAARIGGEEFILFIPNATEREAIAMAQLVRVSFAGRNWDQFGIVTPVTVSCGVSTTNDREPTLDPAIERADRALYAAKTAGRNRVIGEADMASFIYRAKTA